MSTRAKNRFNSRLEFLNSFRSYADPDCNIGKEIAEILRTESKPTDIEISRALFIGVIQRSIQPGCTLQRRVTLIGPDENEGKSTFCKVLAGNIIRDQTGKVGERWYTNANIYTIKNDVTRHAFLKGIAVHEYAEMVGFGKIEVSHFKNEDTTTIDARRRLYREDATKTKRNYEFISSTNDEEYNRAARNRRDAGIKVGIKGPIEIQTFIDRFPVFVGTALMLIENGETGEIDYSLAEEIRKGQYTRLVRNDTMELLEPLFALSHVDQSLQRVADFEAELENGVEPDEDARKVDQEIQELGSDYSRLMIVDNRTDQLKIWQRYQLTYKDELDGDKQIIRRTYYIGSTGLTNYATDYKKHMELPHIKIDKAALTDALSKLHYVQTTIRWKKYGIDKVIRARSVYDRREKKVKGSDFIFKPSWLMVVEAPDIVNVEKKAIEQLNSTMHFIRKVTNWL